MRLVLGADHAGFEMKEAVKKWLHEAGHEIEDVGALTYDPADDYPDYAIALARAVAEGRGERGILICGSGVGACVVANKIKGLRAAICHDTYSAAQAVEHDDVNVLCLGSGVVGPALAETLIQTFLKARFSGEGRHRRRLAKIRDLES